jgi:hypothetical protein
VPIPSWRAIQDDWSRIGPRWLGSLLGALQFLEIPSLRGGFSRIALADWRLAHLWAVYPGMQAYPLDDLITVLPLGDVRDAITEW